MVIIVIGARSALFERAFVLQLFISDICTINFELMAHIPNILSIAGFDPSAGAGLFADIKTAEACGVYACGVLTSLTYQNDVEFDDIDWVETEHIIRQISVLRRRIHFDAVKIGLISDIKALQTIIAYLKDTMQDIPIIWDPILQASAGFTFHDDELCENSFSILQQITLVTPNKPEALQLFTTNNIESIQTTIANNKLCAVLLKGGHADGTESNDILISATETFVFEGVRLEGFQKHGTGCILSTAIACNVAKGKSLIESCRLAKKYITQVLTSNQGLLGYHYLQGE
jgi:hydroxymethylpyrimidine/phosphomethylpyrimidine kinase